jgi:hypothetical protein
LARRSSASARWPPTSRAPATIRPPRSGTST